MCKRPFSSPNGFNFYIDIVFWHIKEFLRLGDTVENSLHQTRSFADKGISEYSFDIKESEEMHKELPFMLQISHSLKCIENNEPWNDEFSNCSDSWSPPCQCQGNKNTYLCYFIPKDDSKLIPQRWLTVWVCVCVLIQSGVWRTTSWWFRSKPPWAATVNSSSGRTMPNMNSSGTPWWVSRIPEMTSLWLLQFSTQPHTPTHTHSCSATDFSALIFLDWSCWLVECNASF